MATYFKLNYLVLFHKYSKTQHTQVVLS